MRYLKTFLGLILLAAIFFSKSPSSHGVSSNRHILLIGLDGISYQTLSKMHEGGYFREFSTHIPMVATFPSISDPNWATIRNVKPEKR